MDLSNLILKAMDSVFPIIKTQEGLYSLCAGLVVTDYNSDEGTVILGIWKPYNPSFTISGTFDKDNTAVLNWIQNNVETSER